MSRGMKIYRRIIEESVLLLGVGTGLVLSGDAGTQTKIGITLIGLGVIFIDHRRALRTIDDIVDFKLAAPITPLEERL